MNRGRGSSFGEPAETWTMISALRLWRRMNQYQQEMIPRKKIYLNIDELDSDLAEGGDFLQGRNSDENIEYV